MTDRKSGGATSRDVARAARVSQSLVSRAFSGNGRIAPETRERIFRVAKDMGWQPNALARSMVTGDAPLVAVITTRLHFDWRARVLSHLLRTIEKWDLKPLLFYAVSDDDVGRLLTETLSWRARGVIVTAGEVKADRAAEVLARGQFLAALNRPVNHPDGFGIATDNRLGGRMAADLLLRLGRHRFLVLGGPADGWAPGLRTVGFVETLREHGFGVTVWHDATMSVEAGRAGGECVLDLPAGLRPDAVFSTNDAMAIGFLDAIRGHLAVPDDVAVIGFDNLPAAAWPPYDLTTFEQPLDRMVAEMIAYIDRHQQSSSGAPLRCGARSDQEEGDSVTYFAPKLLLRSSAGAER